MECVWGGIQPCGQLGKGELGNHFYFCKFSIQVHFPSSTKSYMSGSI